MNLSDPNELVRLAVVAALSAVAGGGAGFKTADVKESGHTDRVAALEVQLNNLRWELRRTNERMRWLTTGEVVFDEMPPPAALMIAPETAMEDLAIEEFSEAIEAQ